MEAHLRDELGHTEAAAARPLQASAASAVSLLLGGLIPFLGLLGPATARTWLVVAVTFVGLACAGILGAKAAGTTLARPALRVVIGGGLAMAITAAVGQLDHVSGI